MAQAAARLGSPAVDGARDLRGLLASLARLDEPARAGLVNEFFNRRVGPALDADAMPDAAQILVGLHDFTTFRATACQSASPVNPLDRLNVRREGQHVIIEAAALSFLHHQVRSMVGCLVAVGLGRWTAADLKAALDAADRSALAENAPPEGLYFVRALYPEETVAGLS